MPPDPHLGSILHLLACLARGPVRRQDLATELGHYLESIGQLSSDPTQKLDRALRKLRSCGFEIDSAPHRPYQLRASNFPVLLTPSQRQAIAKANHLFQQMGFSAEAAELAPLLAAADLEQAADLSTDFSPPADYSDPRLSEILSDLRDRLNQQRRFTIRYRGSQGSEAIYDLDRSELRLHDGILYLFAWVPDLPPWQQSRPLEPVDRNRLFRLDRIQQVNRAADVAWLASDFPTLTVRYQLLGPLAGYQPRRPRERVIARYPEQGTVTLESQEDYPFWFQQRLMRYREHAILLEPAWLVAEIVQSLRTMQGRYGTVTNP